VALIGGYITAIAPTTLWPEQCSLVGSNSDVTVPVSGISRVAETVASSRGVKSSAGESRDQNGFEPTSRKGARSG